MIERDNYGRIVTERTTPLRKDFLVAAQSWPWEHRLGFNPPVEAYNLAGEKMLAYVKHTDTNNLTAEHTYNETGFLLIP